jgi:hypothetical protein
MTGALFQSASPEGEFFFPSPSPEGDGDVELLKNPHLPLREKVRENYS